MTTKGKDEKARFKTKTAKYKTRRISSLRETKEPTATTWKASGTEQVM